MTPDWSAKYDSVPYAKLDNPQTLNLYAYVQNNPLTMRDPDGHEDAGTRGGSADTGSGDDGSGDGSGSPSMTPGEAAMGAFEHGDNPAAAAKGIYDARDNSSSTGTGGPAQQQIHTETTVVVHGGHWWNKMFAGVGIAFARFGRLGGPAHRAAIDRISRLLEEDGYAVTREKYIPTPGGAKGYRFADVYGENKTTGEVRLFQVGRTNADGKAVSREVQAMDDIQGSTGIRPQFVDYNSPLATGEMPVMPTGDMPEPVPEEIPIDPFP